MKPFAPWLLVVALGCNSSNRQQADAGTDGPDACKPDGIHLNEAGSSVAADLVLGAIDRDFDY